MKSFSQHISCLLLCMFLAGAVQGQSAQRYNNSLRFQYGLFQYNSGQDNFIDTDNDNFLSAALTYRHQLGRISGLNFTGRYYQWKLKDQKKLETYAAQAMWVFHARRVGKGWQVNRLTPYAGVGIGVEEHQVTGMNTLDSSFSKFYIPFEAGLLFNLNSRWSVGVFAEYKLATAADIKKLVDAPEGKLDIVNAAGVSLAYHFGRKKKRVEVPVVYTNPFAPQMTMPEKTNHAPIADTMARQGGMPEILVPANLDLVTLQKIRVKPRGIKALIPDKMRRRSKINIDSNKISIDQSTDVAVMKADELAHLGDTSVVLQQTMEVKDVSPKEMSKQEPEVEEQLSLPQVDTSTGKKMIPGTQLVSVDMQNRRLDSILQMMQRQQEQLASLSAQLQAQPPIQQMQPVKETIIIQPVPVRPDDNPAISALKQSYNELGGMAELNYQRGYINNEELHRLRDQANNINRNMQQLSGRDNVAAAELARMYNELAQLQAQVNRDRETTVVPVEAPRQEDVTRELYSLHYKLDKALLELDYMKRAGGDNRQPANRAMEHLIREQALLGEKVKQVEKENLQLKNRLEQQMQQPDTAEKAPVTPAKDEVSTMHAITFPTNSAQVSAADKEWLDRFVAGLEGEDEQMILLSGFADKSGNAAYNMKLSQKRVKAVKNELMHHGMKKEAILERYYGSSKASEQVSENDRKVVVQVLHK